MAKNVFFDAANGYEEGYTRTGHKSIGKRFFVRSFSGEISQKSKKRLSSRLSAVADGLSELISYTSTKAYGAAMLSFGLMALMLHFAKDYISAYTEATSMELIAGIALCVLSVPFLLVDLPMCIALQDFPLTDLILYEFFCVKRMHRVARPRSVPTVLAIVIGAASAVLGCIVPLETVLAVILAALFAYVSFVSPEFSYLVTLLVMPYVSYLPYSRLILPALITLTLVSFLFKVIHGKRVLNIEQYDVIIALMILMILVSGVFVKGVDSFTSSLGMIVLTFGYTLSSNIITNRRLADRALNAVVLSSVPACIMSIVSLVEAAFNGNAMTLIREGVSSSFRDPAEFSAFLTVTLILTVALIKQSHGAARALYTLVLLLNLTSIVLTAQRFAYLALLIGLLAYLALKLRGISVILLPIFFALPYAVLMLPAELLERVLESTVGGLSAEGLLELWRISLGVLADNIWVGIGIGTSSFAEEFAGLGVTGVTDSHNLFIELGLEAGVLAPVFLMLLLIVRLRHRVTYGKYLKHSQVSTMSPVISAAFFALTVLGATNYIWSDASTMYLFWSVFGIGSATLRVSKREYDDRVLYFNGTMSFDSAVADIEIV